MIIPIILGPPSFLDSSMPQSWQPILPTRDPISMTRGRGIARRDEVTIPKPNWWLLPIQISLTLSSKLAITPIFHRFLGTWCVTIFVEVCKTSKNRPKASFSRLFESCRSHPCLTVKSCKYIYYVLWIFPSTNLQWRPTKNLSSKKLFPGFTTVNMVDLYIYSQMDLWFINLSHYT